MDTSARCQSCGMPMSDASFFGTQKDGIATDEYCMFCYKDGAFTQPDLTLEGMIESSVGYMTANLGIPREEAEAMSREVIPGLRRWQAS